MKKLTERNYLLLEENVKSTGDWTTACEYADGNLYNTEADTIRDFCEWLDKNNIGMGRANYEKRFDQYLNDKANSIIDNVVDELVNQATGIDYTAELFRKK